MKSKVCDWRGILAALTAAILLAVACGSANEGKQTTAASDDTDFVLSGDAL